MNTTSTCLIGIRGRILDSGHEILRFFPTMATIRPYLPSTSLRPRACSGMGAQGMKKEIPGNRRNVYPSLLACCALLFAFAAGFSRGAEAKSDSRFTAAAEFSRNAQGIAMLVMLDGEIVFEDYPNGGGVTRATELASGTKSFSGVLALCAVEDGLLTLDEKAAATLSEWRDDPVRKEITLRQILTLTSGIPGGESALKTGRVPTYAESVAAELDGAPGEQFSYGPQPFQVFGEVLRRKLAARDETVMGYLERRILTPLEIKPLRWRKDAVGHPNLPSGAALTARDWATFGEAVRLDGKGLLPPGKIAECFRGTKANPAYGLTWWLPAHGAIGGRAKRYGNTAASLPKDTWMAAGAGGQRLVIVPSLKLVAVRLAPLRATEGRPFNDQVWLRALVAPLVQTVPADAPSAEKPASLPENR